MSLDQFKGAREVGDHLNIGIRQTAVEPLQGCLIRRDEHAHLRSRHIPMMGVHASHVKLACQQMP
jgi:hypothetical protein